VETLRLRVELVGLSDYVWQRLLDRLNGLTDEEYLWEPVRGCWTIRPTPDGIWTWDFTLPEPDPPPVTTIAWRLTHLAVNEDRFRLWLGLQPHPTRLRRAVPATAKAALEAVMVAKTEMQEDLTEVTDDYLWESIGPVGGPFAEDTRVAWVMHILDELIHHAAEVGLLRDLYRERFAR
jgi:DinB superfamily